MVYNFYQFWKKIGARGWRGRPTERFADARRYQKPQGAMPDESFVIYRCSYSVASVVVSAAASSAVSALPEATASLAASTISNHS